MKVVGIIISRCPDGDDDVLFLNTAHDLSSFPFFERKTVKEACLFLARTITPRLSMHRREVIAHEEYIAFSQRWEDGLSVIMITDKDYPQRIAFQCVKTVYVEFGKKISKEEWMRLESDDSADFKAELRGLLKLYKEPANFDAILETQQKVDEAKATLNRTILQVLDNQANLDSLVAKSEDLSEVSKQAFKASKKIKGKFKCCAVQ